MKTTFRKSIKSTKKQMLLTNNQRKIQGLPLHRKSNKDKRFKTRREVWETIEAFLDYCNE